MAIVSRSMGSRYRIDGEDFSIDAVQNSVDGDRFSIVGEDFSVNGDRFSVDGASLVAKLWLGNPNWGSSGFPVTSRKLELPWRSDQAPAWSPETSARRLVSN
jgi:hypothetical protein